MANPIQKFYYPGISDNTDLTNVFDFDNFMDHVKLSTVLSGGGSGVSNIIMNNFIQTVLSVYNSTAQQNTNTFIDQYFQNALSDFIIRNNIATVMAQTTGGNFNINDAGQYKFLSDQIYAIIGSSSIDWSDLTTIQSQMLGLPSSMFAWGSSLTTFAQTFDVNAFQGQVVQLLMANMYIAFYFRHITDRVRNCEDFKCKRAYLLAKYVFVYYTFMSIFLSIFSSSSTVNQFKIDTGLDTNSVETLKYQIVLVMDGVLSQLQNENVLDSPGLEFNSLSFQGIGPPAVSDIQGYYEYLKTLSDQNVLKSNYLNEKKKTATIMQNNLGNYTNQEVLSHKQYVDTKRGFIASVIVMFLVILYIVGLVVFRSYTVLYASSAVILLGLAINGLVAVATQK